MEFYLKMKKFQFIVQRAEMAKWNLYGGTQVHNGGIQFQNGGTLIWDGDSKIQDGSTLIQNDGTLIRNGGTLIQDGGTQPQNRSFRRSWNPDPSRMTSRSE
jgi:hypothetical protein